MLGVGGLVLMIERVDKGITTEWIVIAVVAVVSLALFFWRQTRAPRPLMSLPLAKARTFWVAFVAGAITFGSLIGAMFIGQQYTQNVLGYDTLTAAAVVLPAALVHRDLRPARGPAHLRPGARSSPSCWAWARWPPPSP